MRMTSLLALAVAGLLYSSAASAETPSYREIEIFPAAYKTASGTGPGTDTLAGDKDEPPTDCRVYLRVTGGPTATTTTTLGALLPTFDKMLAWLSPSSAWAANETLTVKVTTQVGGANYTLYTFTAVTTSSSLQTATITECPPNLRAEYTMAGDAPGFTFEVWATRY